MEEEKRLLALAEDCLLLGQRERPELIWLKGVYERFRKMYGLSGRQEADSLIFEKMYCGIPQKPSDTLKIRYWRTGHHVPSNREQCLAFGRALDMNAEEISRLMKGYYDRSDLAFEEAQANDIVYRERKALMEKLLAEYLRKVHPERMRKMKISQAALENNVRHLYYTDALKYVNVSFEQDVRTVERHITSINYGSELVRTFRLFGEIPRRTMIRHLILLGAPYLSRKLLDERLEAFGYLPLQEEHTLVGGEALDFLLIRLLELYEESCRRMEPEQCLRWLQSACRVLDGIFEERGSQNLRFMYFKALKE